MSAASCEFSERVAAFASGEPDDELAAHLPGCAACRAELDEARTLLRALSPLVESARSPGRADAQGELYWADFTRDVRAQLDDDSRAVRRASGRFAWLAAPALCAAAALVWLLIGRELGQPTVGRVPVAPATAVAIAPVDEADDDLLPFGDDADPAGHVAELDDSQLEAVLARLDPVSDDDLAADADPEAALESLDDAELDAVAATLTL